MEITYQHITCTHYFCCLTPLDRSGKSGPSAEDFAKTIPILDNQIIIMSCVKEPYIFKPFLCRYMAGRSLSLGNEGRCFSVGFGSMIIVFDGNTALSHRGHGRGHGWWEARGLLFYELRKLHDSTTRRRWAKKSGRRQFCGAPLDGPRSLRPWPVHSTLSRDRVATGYKCLQNACTK